MYFSIFKKKSRCIRCPILFDNSKNNKTNIKKIFNYFNLTQPYQSYGFKNPNFYHYIIIDLVNNTFILYSEYTYTYLNI